MSSSTRWTSRALVAAGAGGLLVLGAALGAGGVGAASADDTPPTAPPTEPPTAPTTAPAEPPTTAAPERPGTLPPAAAPAEPAPGVPDYTG
jgi:hypothetical protein